MRDEEAFAPESLEEWELYVREQTPEQLWSQARAMNSISFVRTLGEEGKPALYIENVFKLFSNRFTELGLEPPTGGYVDLKEILQG